MQGEAAFPATTKGIPIQASEAAMAGMGTSHITAASHGSITLDPLTAVPTGIIPDTGMDIPAKAFLDTVFLARAVTQDMEEDFPVKATTHTDSNPSTMITRITTTSTKTRGESKGLTPTTLPLHRADTVGVSPRKKKHPVQGASFIYL